MHQHLLNATLRCHNKYFLLLVFMCFAVFQSNAQKATLPVIQLQQKTITASQSVQQWVDSMQQNNKGQSPTQIAIKFATLPDAEQRATLEVNGIYLQEYLSDNTFIAITKRVSKSLKTGTLPQAFVAGIQPSWKVTQIIPTDKKLHQAKLLVACYPFAGKDEFVKQLEALGGKLLKDMMPGRGYYEVQFSAEKINQLAAWYGIRTISMSGEDQSLNLESTRATKVNMAQLPVLSGGYGLLGDSITIGVGDNTSGLGHIDLRDRIINYNPAGLSNHGIHVNGTVGAAGTMNMNGQGFLPHATIVDNLNNLIWFNTGTMVQNHNMSVTNNSYTNVADNCGYAGTYDGYAQAIEDVSLQYPNVIHVFAGGNNGNFTCSPYPPFFGTVTGTYQPAKNILAVGQCTKQYVISSLSSRGPVKDGRLKPEIVAVGTDVVSTLNGDVYRPSFGTSMSSPQVAGAAGLLQQRYKQLHSNTYPSAALVKALLMNGATDKGNPGPDYTWGFGMLNMNRSLKMLNDTSYRLNTIGNSGQQTFTVDVAANTAQLKVMLYYHDRPVSVAAPKQLVNDLDLEVVDPSSNVVLPLILNSTPASVNNNAQQGIDTLNNSEQVTINNPVAGTYTVRVKGKFIPIGTQDYVVAYDKIPTGIELTFPTTGAVVAVDTTQLIYWDASPDTNTFSLEVRLNNLASWHMIDNAIPADQRYYIWRDTFNTNSEQCMMRLTRNGTGEVFTTGAYTTNKPPVVTLNASQCPGYININWAPIPNATAYQVMRKKGFYLQNEALITDTFYSFRGLSLDSMYFVAVQPVFNGVGGYRSLGVKRKPDNGSCAGSYADGDLMIEKLESPVSGRIYTSSQLNTNTTLNIRVRNLNDTSASNYNIAYKLNNGAWQSQNIVTPIAANSTQVISIPTALDLSAIGNYSLQLAVTNLALTDNNPTNDTLKKVIRHLANAPVNISAGFTEDFEAASAYTVYQDSVGVTPNEHWDFMNSNDTGKLSTFINTDITISGNRSASMSGIQFTKAPVVNKLDGTFNLNGYNATTTEVRLEFDYKMHGASHFADSNKVWVRSEDSVAWIPVFSYNRNGVPGLVEHSGSISVTDAIAGAGRTFTTSTQVRFGQQDTTAISLNDFGRGLTIDNIKLYTVTNDVALDSIISPPQVACDLNNSPVMVRVYNAVSATQTNVDVSYSIDNGTPYTYTIASLPGKSSINHTFTQLLTGLSAGTHLLKTWVVASGDSYSANDTITQLIRSQPLIANYPYLENFEQNDGNWYSEGFNSSWQYGTPASVNVTQAASGTKAWKTNLNGTYNDYEFSYLYSPCFDISTLTQPMLSFSVVLDIENCGVLICDGAWVEYSTNSGATWTKLGASGQGYNWYTNGTAQLWNQQGQYRWHVASIPLPATAQPLRLRFVLGSDGGVTFEGISLDDVHIYNKDYGIYNSSTAGPITQTVGGNTYTNFLSGGNVVAQINADGHALGNTDVTVYMHPSTVTSGQFYYLQRSFAVQAAQTPADSITTRLYVLDAEVNNLLNATSCPGCTKPDDVYRLGVAKYDDVIQSNENDLLTDDTDGFWSYFPPGKTKWVPYDNGYYAEVRLSSFSELWFSDGIPLQPLPLGLLSFVLHKDKTSALLSWELEHATTFEQVQLERSADSKDFTPLFIENKPLRQQNYRDGAPLDGINYYRLALKGKDGKTLYSKALSAIFGADDAVHIYPNPAQQNVTIEWPAITEEVNLQIHNALGQLMFSQVVKSESQLSVSLKNFVNGLYTVNVKYKNVQKNFKLVVAK